MATHLLGTFVWRVLLHLLHNCVEHNLPPIMAFQLIISFFKSSLNTLHASYKLWYPMKTINRLSATNMLCYIPLLMMQSWTCLHATRSFCFKYYLKTSIYVYESIAMPCYSCFFKTIITSFKVFALWICILTLLPCILCLNPLVLLSKVLHLPTLFLNNLMHQYILRQNNIHKLENVIQIIQYAYTSMHLWSFCISPMHNIFQKIIKFIKHLHRKYHKANKEKNVMHKPNP